ncbi:MAG: hypothetical protein N2C14_00770, partial [Planctomycetales bacterium]
MTGSTTLDFLGRIAAHRLLPPEQLDHLRRLSPKDAESHEVAVKLVEHGLLTRWQAECLLFRDDIEFNIGGYRLIEPVGQGSRCMVYRAVRV